MILKSLWHYPVKGIGGGKVDQASLTIAKHFPGDRLFAVGNGHAKHRETPPGAWLKKAFFLQLLKHERLAELDCALKGDQIRFNHHGKMVLEADIGAPDSDEGQAAMRRITAFFTEFMGDEAPGELQFMRCGEGAYTDQSQPLISLGGSASLDAFAKMTGTNSDARRFRLNMIFETSAAYEEETLLLDKIVTLGSAQLRVVEPVGRCGAINVDPTTAKRGPDYLRTMRETLGHSDLGVFAIVTKGGIVKPGDRLEVNG